MIKLADYRTEDAFPSGMAQLVVARPRMRSTRRKKDPGSEKARVNMGQLGKRTRRQTGRPGGRKQSFVLQFRAGSFDKTPVDSKFNLLVYEARHTPGNGRND